MLYRIIIKEVVSKVEYIEAEDQYGALEEAQRMYDNGEIDMEKEVEAEVDYTCVCEEVERGKVMLNGFKVDYDVCVNLMDDELREEIHAEIAPCTEQEFLDEYADRHMSKYGQTFTI